MFKHCSFLLLISVALKTASCCNSKKYIIGEGELTWSEAKGKCKAHGMEIATVTSEEDKNEISKLLDKCRPRDGLNNGLWLGGYKRKGENWMWSSKRPLDVYEMWGPGQPDYCHGDERCLEIYREMGNWYWNDIQCKFRKRYICQNKI